MTKKRAATKRDQNQRKATVESEGSSGSGRLSEHFGLYVLVFVAGAVLMGLEITGSRVLAPYFGNSVFIWGSLISVFLTSLAIGYYGGGRLADKYPSLLLLTGITIFVSVWIVLLASVSHRVCEALFEKGLGEKSGPLVTSVILFLPPSVGLGILSPFAVRIAASSVQSLGKVAGTLYALSTTGSIFGTLATTFVLIPWLGHTTILKVLGGVLLLSSAVPFLLSTRSKGGAAAYLAPCILFTGILMGQSQTKEIAAHETLVFDTGTPYHQISVVDNALSNSREMRFDRYIESAISLTPPYQTLANYTNYFNLVFLMGTDVRQALFIGAGGGVGPRAFSAHDENIEIDVVDIDQEVLNVAQEFFFLETNEKVHCFAEDGRIFVRSSSKQYDCIVLDAFTIGGRIPFHLVTQEFLELCDTRMNDNGIFFMNINSSLVGENSQIFQSMYATLKTVFPQAYVFALNHTSGSAHQSTNIILVGSKEGDAISPEQWRSLARDFRSDSPVGRALMIDMVKNLVEVTSRDDDAPIFTDDYSPIEMMRF